MIKIGRRGKSRVMYTEAERERERERERKRERERGGKLKRENNNNVKRKGCNIFHFFSFFLCFVILQSISLFFSFSV